MLKWRLLGGVDRLGRFPVTMIRSRCSSTVGSRTGTADISACVYGLRRVVYSSSRSVSSVSFPKARHRDPGTLS